MQKRRKRKRGYGSWWFVVGQVAKGTFIGRGILWIAKGGEEIGFVGNGFGVASGLARNSLVWEAVGD